MLTHTHSHIHALTHTLTRTHTHTHTLLSLALVARIIHPAFETGLNKPRPNPIIEYDIMFSSATDLRANTSLLFLKDPQFLTILKYL